MLLAVASRRQAAEVVVVGGEDACGGNRRHGSRRVCADGVGDNDIRWCVCEDVVLKMVKW